MGEVWRCSSEVIGKGQRVAMDSNTQFSALFAAIIICVVFLSANHTTPASNAPGLERTRLVATISALPGASTSNLQIRFELQNNNAHTITILKWFTPLEGVMSDMFDVAALSAGAAHTNTVPYTGMMAKRAFPPPPDALLELAPGQTHSKTVVLTDAYKWEKGAAHTVQFNRVLSFAPVESRYVDTADMQSVDVLSNPIRIQL